MTILSVEPLQEVTSLIFFHFSFAEHLKCKNSKCTHQYGGTQAISTAEVKYLSKEVQGDVIEPLSTTKEMKMC